jgi:alpha-glucosidase
MALAFPGRPEYVDGWDQYLLGPDILVRPMWEPGATQVAVLIPEGTWVDVWTGAVVRGPTTAVVAVPLHVIPVFVRAGSDLSLGDLWARWEEAQARARARPNLPALAGSVR